MTRLTTLALAVALFSVGILSNAEAKKDSAWGQEYARCPAAISKAQAAPESRFQTEMSAALKLCRRAIKAAAGLLQKLESTRETEEALEDLWICEETVMRSEKDFHEDHYGGVVRKQCCALGQSKALLQQLVGP